MLRRRIPERIIRQLVPPLLVLGLLLLHLFLTGRWWVWTFLSWLPSDAFLWLAGATLAWTVWKRAWWGLLPLALALPIAIGISDINPAALLPTSPPSLDTRVTVFNWNTEHWQDDRAGLYEFLRAQDADVYQLQERVTIGGERIGDGAEIARAFPEYTILEYGELLTLSRLPVITSAPVRQATVLRADISVGGRVVSFYNAHIPVFVTTQLLDSPVALREDVRRRFDLRAREFAQLEEEVATNTLPQFLSGDFNTTLLMRQMGTLRSSHTDTIVRSPRLSPATWHDGLRLWRIDYALVRDLVVASHEEVDPQGLSDHWGLRTVVGW